MTPPGQDPNTPGRPRGERAVTGGVRGKDCEVGVSDGGAGTTFHPVPAGLLCLLLLGPVLLETPARHNTTPATGDQSAHNGLSLWTKCNVILFFPFGNDVEKLKKSLKIRR